MLPYIMGHQVVELTEIENGRSGELNGTILYQVDYVQDNLRRAVVFWTSAVLIKALPILIMTAMSVALIISIRQSEKRYRSLQPDKKEKRHLKFTQVPNVQSQNGDSDTPVCQKRHLPKSSIHNAYISSGRNANQTTYMLLAIIILYIITYLPQSAMLLANEFLGGCFRDFVYARLGDLLDFLTLVNNGLNFLLYCSMSRQFRETFLSLFCAKSS
ncbi:unnamed protein product [Calicophoron daubneyi]|uniref:G-protein coupled receptors family 1 profile domain-containing protein n=1 Tax=Calicophoron daubneyi TaxID=300641 RepID=A0AAV2TUW6_CALDB